MTFVGVVACVSAAGSIASAATITVQAFPQTGEIRFVNTSAEPFDFVFYWIRSTNGGLIGSSAVWKSISGNFDASGDGSIDSAGDWSVFNRSPFELAEGAFFSEGRLAPFGFYQPGPIWNPSASPAFDLSVLIVQPENQVADVNLVLALEGDYDGDQVVGAQDYNVWKSSFASTSAPLVDGNLNGIVDAADYTVWRDNLGASLPGSAAVSAGTAALVSAALAIAAVPEPGSASLVVIALVVASMLAGRHRGR